MQPRSTPVKSTPIKSGPIKSGPVKSARLDARIPPDLLRQLKRAAELQGRSLSDYVAGTLSAAAQRDIADFEIVRLSRAASERFAAALFDAPDPVPALGRAFALREVLIDPA